MTSSLDRRGRPFRREWVDVVKIGHSQSTRIAGKVNVNQTQGGK
jgi:RNA polymerase subunit RPABC4/transcription elongation factor Spt4